LIEITAQSRLCEYLEDMKYSLVSDIMKKTNNWG